MVNAISACFKKYFTTSGRASRSEFWWFFLVAGMANTAAEAAGMAIPAPGGALTAGLVRIAFCIPLSTAWVRRLHDIGKSGWYYGASFALSGFCAVEIVNASVLRSKTAVVLMCISLAVFLLYAVFLLVISAFKGNPGENKYGPPPRSSGSGN